MATPTFPCHAVTPTMHPMTLSLTKTQQEERKKQVRGNRSSSAPASGLSRLFGFFLNSPAFILSLLGQMCQGAERPWKYLLLSPIRVLSWGPCLSVDSAFGSSNKKVMLYKDK